MKRLVVCCDGTWNRADQALHDVPCPTNVVGLAFRVAERDGQVPQFIYYDQGVGTGNVVDRISGGAFGEGLVDNIYDGYRFLMANYEPGDEIFLFGFSRGAYTVRSLGGMIRKCGILARASVAKYRAALQFYRRPDCHPNDDEAVEFRTQHSVCGPNDIPIRFMGVWDTVGALGIPLRGLRSLTRRSHQFHDTELSKCVQSAYHALAIDEHRGPFVPTLWAYQPKPGQTIEQTWFCGAHSDVGGGYGETGLSDITLQWMMEKARAAGLAFDQQAIAAYPLHPDHRAPLHDSMRGLYLLTPGIDRAIGTADKGSPHSSTQTDPTQSVHESALRRWDEDPDYRAASLREYFGRTGDRRVTTP